MGDIYENTIGFKKFEEQIDGSEELGKADEIEAQKTTEADFLQNENSKDLRTEEERDRDRSLEFKKKEEEWAKNPVDNDEIFRKRKKAELEEKIKLEMGVSELTEDIVLEYDQRVANKVLEQEKAAQEEIQSSQLVIGSPVAIKDLDITKAQREWIWENYLAKRHITLLSALWKAGKSTLIRCLLRSMQSEEEFAGMPTFNRNVLLVTEEPEEDWVEKREDFGLENIENVYVWSRPLKMKPNTKQWIEFIDIVAAEAERLKIDLIVIDTLSTFWPIDNENDSAQVMKALIPLFTLTSNNAAVLLVHHFRKGGGDQAQASRGSGALTGFVSNIIEFTRVEGTNAKNTQRVLKSYGRFDDANPEVVIELTPDNTYVFKGNLYEVSKRARMERLICVFEESKEALSCRDVIKLWDDTRYGDVPNIRQIQRYISELLKKEIVTTVREEIVVRKKTPFYALKGGYKEQLTLAYPPSYAIVASSVFSDDNDKNKRTHDPINNEANYKRHDSAKSKENDGASPLKDWSDF